MNSVKDLDPRIEKTTNAGQTKLSFIIPALNEANNVTATILAIQNSINKFQYEIVLVDNGSTDGTPEIAEKLGIDTYIDPVATIAKLRNLGAARSNGQILCFIDSDVSISQDWDKELYEFLFSSNSTDPFITGSRCIIEPYNSSFIERNWFSLLQKTTSNYINSGHLIATRKAFSQLSGFNEDLTTGEDYDLCQRAQSIGIPIIENKNLKAFHRGYPKTINEFILREAWHGRSDTENIKNIFRSKTALISYFNFILLIALLTGIILENMTLFMLSGLLILSTTIYFTTKKFGFLPITQLAKTAFCSYTYMLGRVFSILFRKRRPPSRN